MTTEAQRHAQFAKTFSELAARTTDWSAPTPVIQWRASDIVDHLITWMPPVLSGGAGIDLDDPAGDGPVARWDRRTRDVQAVLDDPALANRTMQAGPFAGQSVAGFLDRAYTADIFMHSWDLPRANADPADLDRDYATLLLDGLRGIQEIIRSSGQYGDQQPTQSSDPLDQLVAFIGRDPQWQPQPRPPHPARVS